MNNNFVRNVALAGPTVILLALIGTAKDTAAYPGDVFTAGAPVKGPSVQTAVEVATGSYSVSQQTGAAQYSFPIPVPPGRNGMQPSLSLEYSSQNPLRGGIAAGWVLTGLPSIEVDTSQGRLAGTFYRSNLAGGQRLVRVSEFPAAGSQEYRAESDSDFVRYRKVDGDLGSTGYWVALHPNGTTFYFGEFESARDQQAFSQQVLNPIEGRWMITRMIDVHGNSVGFNWQKVQGRIWGQQTDEGPVDLAIASIEYGNNLQAGLTAHARVEFGYTAELERCPGSAVPKGAAFTYRNGFRTYLGAKKLEYILVKARQTPTSPFQERRRIFLHYDEAADNCSESHASLRLLDRISQIVMGSDGAEQAVPAITFGYGTPERTPQPVEQLPAPLLGPGANPSGLGDGRRHLNPDQGGGWPSVRTMIVDVDGDSFPDVLQSQASDETSCEVRLYRGGPDGFAATGIDVDWPLRPWEGPTPHLDGANKETCSLSYQLDRRTTADQPSCPSRSANYRSNRLIDLDRDGVPELISAVDFKPGRYNPADPDETALMPQGLTTANCPVSNGPCRNGEGQSVDCVADRPSIVPQVPTGGGGLGDPTGPCGSNSCPFEECLDPNCEQQVIDGSGECGLCECGTQYCGQREAFSLIGDYFQRNENSASGGPTSWFAEPSAIEQRPGFEERPTFMTGMTPSCRYEPEWAPACHKYLWRKYLLNTDPDDVGGFNKFGPAATALSPIPLESTRASAKLAAGGVIGGFHAIIDIDGDGCVDGVWQQPSDKDRTWSGDLQVFRGDCAGGFVPSSTGAPYIWKMPQYYAPPNYEGGTYWRLRLEHSRTGGVIGGPTDSPQPWAYPRFTEEVAALRDINGDGLPDYVTENPNGQGLEVFFNTGAGFERHLVQTAQVGQLLSTDYDFALQREETIPLYNDSQTKLMQAGWSQAIYREIDFDNDGLMDVVELSPPTIGSDSNTDDGFFNNPNGPWEQDRTVIVHINTGDHFLPGPAQSNSPWWSGLARITVTQDDKWVVKSDMRDFNGDGLPDQAGNPTSGNESVCAPPYLTIPANGGQSSFLSCSASTSIERDPGDAGGQGLRLLRTVDNGHGARVEFDYATSTSPDVFVTNDHFRMPTPVWVVRRMDVYPGSTAAGPAAAVASSEYDYIHPIFNQDRRGQYGFRGFEYVRVWYPPNAAGVRRRTHFIYKYDVDYSGRLWKTRIYEDGVMQSFEVIRYASAPLFGGAVESIVETGSDLYTCASPGGQFGGLASAGESGLAGEEAIGEDEEDPYSYLEVPPEAEGGIFSGAMTASASATSATCQAAPPHGASSQAECEANGVLKRVANKWVPVLATGGASISYSAIAAGDLPAAGDVRPVPAGSTAVMYVLRGERVSEFSPVTAGDRGDVHGETLLYSQNRYEILPTDERKVVATGAGWGAGMTVVARSQTVYDTGNLGLPERISVWQDDVAVATTVRDFDTQTGNVKKVKKPQQLANEAIGGPELWSKTTYDDFELYPMTIENELGQLVETTYDVHTGKQTRIAGPEQPGKGWPEVLTVYDGQGRATRVSRSIDSGSAYQIEEVTRTTYADYVPTTGTPESVIVEQKSDYQADTWIRRQTTFDGLGRPLAESALISPTAATSMYEYDPAGNLVTFSAPSPADGSQLATYSYCHDTLGRITQAVQPDGAGEWQFEFNGKTTARRQIVNDASAPMESTLLSDSFDRLRFVTETTSQGPATWTYEYDPNDNVTHIVDPDGIETELDHDFVSHRKIIERDGRQWRYGYDLNGNMATEETPNPGGTTFLSYISTWTYDALDRVKSHTPAPRALDSGDLVRFYGADTDAGRMTLYQYDQTGHGSGIGHLTTVVMPIGTTTFNYSAEGWVSREHRTFRIQPLGAVLTDETTTGGREYFFSYNGLGQPIQVKHADRAPGATNPLTLNTVYDERGLPTELIQVTPTTTTPLLAHLDRNLAGVPTVRASALAQGQTWTYDSLGRVVDQGIRSCLQGAATLDQSRACATTGTERAGEELAYYESGNPETLRDPINQTTTAFTFDEQHQLESAITTSSVPSSTEYEGHFTYYAGGRLKSASVNSDSIDLNGVRNRNVDYQYDPEQNPAAVSALTDVGTGFQRASFAYDLSGNLTHRSYDGTLDETHDFTYDGDDLVREAILADGSGEVYYYDHNGQRILSYRVPSGVGIPTLRQWFGATEIEYQDVAGTLSPTRFLVFASLGAMPVARLAHGSTGGITREMLYSGVLGSLLAVLTTGGTLRARYGYGPFGEELYRAGSGTADYHRLYEGKEQDESTSLSYFGFRYYDRLTMTWTQADPQYRFAADLAWDLPRRANLYGFNLNNPLVFVDPDGRESYRLILGGNMLQSEFKAKPNASALAQYERAVTRELRRRGVVSSRTDTVTPVHARTAREVVAALKSAKEQRVIWVGHGTVVDKSRPRDEQTHGLVPSVVASGGELKPSAIVTADDIAGALKGNGTVRSLTLIGCETVENGLASEIAAKTGITVYGQAGRYEMKPYYNNLNDTSRGPDDVKLERVRLHEYGSESKPDTYRDPPMQ